MKKVVSLLLIAVLLFSCFTVTAFARSTESRSCGYHIGEVLVSVQIGTPRSLTKARSTIKELLRDFEIESLAMLSATETHVVFEVVFTKKTDHIMQEAITALEQSEDVKFAKPNGDEYWFCEPDDFAPGAIIVCGSGFGELLKDFEIESVRLLTPGSSLGFYCVRFVEKTKEIVWEALEVLENSPSIKYADPDYYAHPAVVEPRPTQSSGQWKVGDPIDADAIVDAANDLYNARDLFPTEDIQMIDSYKFENEPAYAVNFAVKGYGYYTVMLEKHIGEYLLYTSLPQPYIFFGNRLYPFEEAYKEGVLTDEMLTELAESSYTGGNGYCILTEYIKGDTDGDGDVSIIDATVIQRHEANVTTGAFYKPLADVDGDSEVNVIDATLIQRSEAGIYTIK